MNPTFKDLIHLTKVAELKCGEFQNTPANSPLYPSVLQAMHEANAQLARCSIGLFTHAQDGDDISIVSGRMKGDDDDSLGAFFEGPKNGYSVDQFKRICLEIDPVDIDDETDDSDSVYIINDLPLSDMLAHYNQKDSQK